MKAGRGFMKCYIFTNKLKTRRLKTLIIFLSLSITKMICFMQRLSKFSNPTRLLWTKHMHPKCCTMEGIQRP